MIAEQNKEYTYKYKSGKIYRISYVPNIHLYFEINNDKFVEYFIDYDPLYLNEKIHCNKYNENTCHFVTDGVFNFDFMLIIYKLTKLNVPKRVSNAFLKRAQELNQYLKR